VKEEAPPFQGFVEHPVCQSGLQFFFRRNKERARDRDPVHLQSVSMKKKKPCTFTRENAYDCVSEALQEGVEIKRGKRTVQRK
jgi:hypothetical protein